MSRQAVVVLLMVALLAASGCGGSSTGQRPPSTPTPSPTASVGSVVIKSISPPSAVAGSPDLTLTITGSNFANFFTGHKFAQALWSGTVLATTFVNDTELTAVIPAPLMSAPTSVQIFVEYGDRM